MHASRALALSAMMAACVRSKAEARVKASKAASVALGVLCVPSVPPPSGRLPPPTGGNSTKVESTPEEGTASILRARNEGRLPSSYGSQPR